MPVKEKHLDPADDIHRREVYLQAQTVLGDQANVLVDSFRPGYAFQVLAVQHFAESVTATADYDVDIGTTSALNAHTVPTAGARGSATLATALGARRGTATEDLNLRVTTNTAGRFTGLKVKVTIRKVGIGGLPDQPGTL